tara:strand:- start:13 stop:525 length:513 start_codon:yes stop_codon:yes gene_type:complete
VIKLRNLYAIIGFKITWISCVFGELYYNSFVGLIVGLIFLIFFFLFEVNKLSSFRLVFYFSIIGYGFDSILSYFEFYNINASTKLFLLPIWFIVLWLSFCCLLVNVLTFFKNYPKLSFFFGFTLGPISYYAGIPIGLVKAYGPESFILIGTFWGLMMFVYSQYALNKKLL